jgi:propanol-preferring alcohol dehydrogenase
VYGISRLGHLAPQYAHIARATVAAIDHKLEMTRRLGARYAINGTEDPAEAIQALGGADSAIVLAAVPSAFEQALASLRPNGTLVMVALPADNIMRLPIFETVLKGIRVVRSLVGTRVDLAENLRLASGRPNQDRQRDPRSRSRERRHGRGRIGAGGCTTRLRPPSLGPAPFAHTCKING